MPSVALLGSGNTVSKLRSYGHDLTLNPHHKPPSSRARVLPPLKSLNPGAWVRAALSSACPATSGNPCSSPHEAPPASLLFKPFCKRPGWSSEGAPAHLCALCPLLRDPRLRRTRDPRGPPGPASPAPAPCTPGSQLGTATRAGAHPARQCPLPSWAPGRVGTVNSARA